MTALFSFIACVHFNASPIWFFVGVICLIMDAT